MHFSPVIFSSCSPASQRWPMLGSISCCLTHLFSICPVSIISSTSAIIHLVSFWKSISLPSTPPSSPGFLKWRPHSSVLNSFPANLPYTPYLIPTCSRWVSMIACVQLHHPSYIARCWPQYCANTRARFCSTKCSVPFSNTSRPQPMGCANRCSCLQYRVFCERLKKANNSTKPSNPLTAYEILGFIGLFQQFQKTFVSVVWEWKCSGFLIVSTSPWARFSP